MEDGTQLRAAFAKGSYRPARPAASRISGQPRKTPVRQHVDLRSERDVTLALGVRRLEREHVALLLAICELDAPTSATIPAKTATGAMNSALHLMLREDLYRTQHALALAAQGRYGRCEDCQRLLSHRQIELKPSVTRCASCAARQRAAN